MSTLPCAIVGAGPAGVSAAVWLTTLGIAFEWYGRSDQPGGMLRRVHNRIENFPPNLYENGQSLIDELSEYIRSVDLEGPEARRVDRIIASKEYCRIRFEDGEDVLARLVIIATGTSYRMLGIPGESEGLGRHVSQSATADADRFAGRPVAVVGGGDAGFENALRLATAGCQVNLLLRNNRVCARHRFVDAVHAHPDIIIHPIPTTIQAISKTAKGCALHLDRQGRPETLDVACLFIRIGVDPCLPHIEPSLDTHDGFLLVDAFQRTSHPRVLAAGDVTHTPLRSVATAMGAGAIAARTAAHHLSPEPCPLQPCD
ncbi:MAG: NAD(P)/FAD-dependent oxidoreductase [Bradymonadaceae bacterium]